MEAVHDEVTARDAKATLLEAIEKIPSQTENSSGNQPKDLEDAIRKWVSSAREVQGQTGELLYRLQGSSRTCLYKESLPAHTLLSEADLARFRRLQSLEARCHFNVFIANVEKRESGIANRNWSRAYSDGEDEFYRCPGGHFVETDWTSRIVLSDGSDLKTPHILRMEPESDILTEADLNTTSTCSAGKRLPQWLKITRRYRSLALLMIPQRITTTYFLKNSMRRSDEKIADLFEYFLSKCSSSESDDEVLKTLTRLCELTFCAETSFKNSTIIPEQIIIKIFETVFRRQSQPLFDLVWNNYTTEYSPQFFSWILPRFRDSSMLSLPTLILSLDRSIFAQNTLGERFKFIRSLSDADNKLPKELEPHVFNLFDNMVGLCCQPALSEQDAEVFVSIACCYRGYEWLMKTISPFVRKKHENATFILRLCWELYVSVTQDKLQAPNAIDWLKTTISSIISRLDVRKHLADANGFQAWKEGRGTQHVRSQGPAPAPATSQTFLNLCTLLLNLGMEEALHTLAEKLIICQREINLTLLVPFAGCLINAL
ncbi:hypothetical protein F5B19DRAFT_315095 [Rostrohypoxylon terebratum]|nr:hypothetical protein F5B19DRAFT_315095 [Rostrohypoxylon terebratum]